jgi:putative transposase
MAVSETARGRRRQLDRQSWRACLLPPRPSRPPMPLGTIRVRHTSQSVESVDDCKVGASVTSDASVAIVHGTLVQGLSRRPLSRSVYEVLIARQASGRTPWVRSARCESFDDPGEWVEGTIACRDAGTHRAGPFAAERGRPAARRGDGAPEVWKLLEVSEATYHGWRGQFGGMKADDVKRLKELEGREREAEAHRRPSGARVAALREVNRRNW